MYYVYILKSLKDNKSLYIGYTEDLNKRIKEHNNNLCLTTKKYSPWEIAYLEGYKNQKDALDRDEIDKRCGVDV